jgi:hypothetical protein
MVIFALVFLYVYRVTPYRSVSVAKVEYNGLHRVDPTKTSQGDGSMDEEMAGKNSGTAYHGGPMGISAVFSALNISDMVGGCLGSVTRQ